MKTITDLAKELAKREGLKKSVDIAQIRELLGHLSDIYYENFIAYILFNLGEKRAKAKARKRKK